MVWVRLHVESKCLGSEWARPAASRFFFCIGLEILKRMAHACPNSQVHVPSKLANFTQFNVFYRVVSCHAFIKNNAVGAQLTTPTLCSCRAAFFLCLRWAVLCISPARPRAIFIYSRFSYSPSYFMLWHVT